jgi:hypothetical protein
MPFSQEKMVEVAILDDSVEVSALAAILEERGIRFLMEPIGSSSFAGIFELQKGQARLKVFKEDEDTAKNLLDEFLESPILDDDNAEEGRDTTL